MNLGSQLETIKIGASSNLTISNIYIYIWANLSKEKLARIAKKCADFDNRLIITW